MILHINDKDYEVHFGIAFVRELDAKYHVPAAGGATFGIGLETLVSRFLAGDMTALADILYFGTVSEKMRPLQKDVDSYVDAADIDALCEEVTEELKKQGATKKKTNELIQNLKSAEEEAKKAKR